MKKTSFLPMFRHEMLQRGWEELDIILISGDAYVDHPSYGVSMIGRFLEQRGYRVGIIAQPDWRSTEDFKRFGQPRLFFGITSGNVDSMIANYTANKRQRTLDDYSPERKTGLRPDRAVIVYANRVREAFGESVPIVIGGIEASLRRFAHYDYWDNRVRRSILFDSRAHILVYGMGERQVEEIARRLSSGEPVYDLHSILGTAFVKKTVSVDQNTCILPSFETVCRDPGQFNKAFVLSKRAMDPAAGFVLAQPHGDQFLVVNPPAAPLQSEELDALYQLPFTRSWHPHYESSGGINALETVRFSVTAHRGCCGECSFCALFFHQGRIVQSRSPESILQEITHIAQKPDFKGTITDIGGPTANLYGAHCSKWMNNTFCEHRSCLVPQPCPHLHLAYRTCIDIYRKAAHIAKVKHVFISSGLRFDLLVAPDAAAYLQQICRHHISGIIKIAPEHCSNRVLRLMNKPSFKIYKQFVARFQKTVREAGKKIYIVNYFITSHPGTSLNEAYELAHYCAQNKIKPEQIQDFIPSPMTRSTCMYFTGRDPITEEQVYTPQTFRERKMHRALVQYGTKKTRALFIEALQILKKQNMLSFFEKALPKNKSHVFSALSSSNNSGKRKRKRV